jgi:hypothetical protein
MEGITKELLENGYIIHNDIQISIEIDGQIILYAVEDTAQFVIDNQLVKL